MKPNKFNFMKSKKNLTTGAARLRFFCVIQL